MQNKYIHKLYKKNEKGEVVIKEVNEKSFSSKDDFNEAMDFYYFNGFEDSLELFESPPIKNSNNKSPKP